MFRLIFLIVIAVLFGYFSTQNTTPVSITLAGYNFQDLPLYLVIGISFLIGLFLSWVLSLIGSLSVRMKLRKKEHHIQDAKKTIHELTKQVNKLEIENAELKGQLDPQDADPDAI